MARYPGFCGGSSQSQSLVTSTERTVNFYPERPGSRYAKVQGYVLYPTPGVASKVTAADSPGRGLFAENGRCFPILGRKYYEMSTGFVLTERGSMATDQYPATVSTFGDAGDQNFVTSGGEGYIHDLNTNGFTAEVSGATMGGMLDGYFLRFDILTSTLAISDLLDGTTWDPLQFVQRSAASDPWKAMLVRPPGIYLIGEKTGDVYYNANAFPFPFRQIANVRIQEGIIAPFSLKDFPTGPIWLSGGEKGSGKVVQAQGYRAVTISSPELAWAISQYARTSRIDDAVAFVYEDQNHTFYELNFPTAGATWVFDGATQLWHERGHWNVGTARYEAWGPQYHTMFNGLHIVADHRSGTLYDMAVTNYSDTAGDVLRRERIAPAIADGNRRIRIPWIELIVDTGVGIPGGAGADPKIALSISRDSGKTFGSERLRSAGAAGEFGKRLIFTRNGSAWGGYAVKIVCTDPAPWRIIDCEITAKKAA